MHEIFGERFYGRFPAWHRLGYVADKPTSATEALHRVGPFETTLESAYVRVNGVEHDTGFKVVTRHPVHDDPTFRFFAAARQYNLIGVEDIVQIFDSATNQPVETLGVLGKGSRMFITWKNGEIEVHGDPVQLYGFLAVGFDKTLGAQVMLTTIRVVCQNTWNAAIGKLGDGGPDRMLWRASHRSPKIAQDLSRWLRYAVMQSYDNRKVIHDIFVALDNRTDVNLDILGKIYPEPRLPVVMPGESEEDALEEWERRCSAMAHSKSMVANLFNGFGVSIPPTRYGLFQAVVEYENWYRRSGASSIMLGASADRMQLAMRELLRG